MINNDNPHVMLRTAPSCSLEHFPCPLAPTHRHGATKPRIEGFTPTKMAVVQSENGWITHW